MAILYMLVDAGADVNARLIQSCEAENKDQVTPLWLAMKTGNVSIARVLLQCGADTKQTYENKTLWNWVVQYPSDQNERYGVRWSSLYSRAQRCSTA